MGLLDVLRTTFVPTPDQQEVDKLKQEVNVLREQMNYSAGSYDPDIDLSASGGGSWYFTPLSRSERELSPFAFQRALNIAFVQYESNPLAKAVLEITRDYVLGEGVVFAATEPTKNIKDALQEVQERFWDDDINQLDIKLFDKVLELGLFGEQIYPVTVNKKDGHVQLGYIDPAHVMDVITNPDNVEEKLAVKVRGMKALDPPSFYKIISEQDDPNDKWFSRLVTAEEGESFSWEGETYQFSGSCFYFAVNKVTNARRGRSDLLSLIDWLDAYDQMLFNEMDRATLLKNFVWDVAMQGATDKSIEEYKQKNPAPRPGSVRYHSDKVKWDAVTPDLKTTDAQNLSELFISYIGTGSRMPKTWLNGTMDVNRAAAQELGEPAFKRLTARQKLVKYMITYMLRFVFDQAEIAGKLKRRSNAKGSIRPNPWKFSVTMPELRPKDLASASSTLVNCVQACTAAIPAKLIDINVAQELIALVVAHIGVEVDMEQMRKRLEQQDAEAEAQGQQQQLPNLNINGTQNGTGTGGGLPPANNNNKPSNTNSQGNPTYYDTMTNGADYDFWQSQNQ